jgi:TolB protein
MNKNINRIFLAVVSIWLSACQSASQPAVTAGPFHTASPVLSDTPIASPTFTRIPTETATPFLTKVPTLSPTPLPVERLAFIQGSETVAFVNSDATGFEQPDYFEPFGYPGPTFHLAISPDGRYVVFDGADTQFPCPTVGSDCGPTNYGLWLADLQQDVVIPIAIKDPAMKYGLYSFNLGAPSWSPDGRLLVAPLLAMPGEIESAEKELAINLYVYDVETGTWTQITNEAGSLLFPSWSPDQEWIAFVDFTSPATNPACKSLIAPENAQGCNEGALYVMRPDGSEMRLLVDTIYLEADIFNYFEPYNAPAWSPDGQSIATLVGKEQSDLLVVNVQTGEVNTLAESASKEHSPIWSPRGDQIAFVSERDGNTEIYVVSSNGSSLMNLTANAAFDLHPIWSPSGNLLAFLSNRDGMIALYVISIDGNLFTRISNDFGVVRRLSWFPSE